MLNRSKKLVALLLLLVALASNIIAQAADTAQISGYANDTYHFVTFGKYPQNGAMKEPILWRVLYRADNQVYLLSEYLLDCRPFDDDSPEWKNSTIRKWLNGSFYKSAFPSDALKGCIYKTKSVGAKVFLPSKNDFLNPKFGFKKGVHDKDTRRSAYGTQHAIDSGLWTNDSGKGSFYTRTKSGSNTLWQIQTNGDTSAARIDRDNVGIRPAIYINLNKVNVTGGTGTLDDPFSLVPIGD